MRFALENLFAYDDQFIIAFESFKSRIRIYAEKGWLVSLCLCNFVFQKVLAWKYQSEILNILKGIKHN